MCVFEAYPPRTVARDNINQISSLPIAIVIEGIDDRTELKRHRQQARYVFGRNALDVNHGLNSFFKINPVLIPVQTARPRTRLAGKGTGLKESRSPGLHRDRGGTTVDDGHRTGWIEDATDG